MKLLIIAALLTLSGCNAASYRHVNGNDVTLVTVKPGATAQVTTGSTTITLNATACQ